jgi:hypothetical protein
VQKRPFLLTRRPRDWPPGAAPSPPTGIPVPRPTGAHWCPSKTTLMRLDQESLSSGPNKGTAKTQCVRCASTNAAKVDPSH